MKKHIIFNITSESLTVTINEQTETVCADTATKILSAISDDVNVEKLTHDVNVITTE